MLRYLLSAMLACLMACGPTTEIRTDQSVVSSKGPVLPPQSMINLLRRDRGLAPVARSARLDRAARAHARDMAANGFFGHRGSNGSTHTLRIKAQGCGGGAENIADGPYTRESVIAAWLGSPDHRRNMLLPAVTHYGLANEGRKWVMTLSRGCP